VLLGFALAVGGCKTDLYSKLTEHEANQIISVLARNNISASRVYAKDGTIVVRVDEASFSDAVAVLNEAGLPRQKFASMGDVFADTKLVSSPTEERARFIYALSQELTKTLGEIDGVLAARVHLVLPRNDPLKEDEKPSSASVFIKYDPDTAVNSLMPQIKTLVINSVEGLTYDRVSVVFVPGEKRRTAPAVPAVKSASLGGDEQSAFDASPTTLLAGAILIVTLVAGGFGWQRWRQSRTAR
jgi:type III secretion protein J